MASSTASLLLSALLLPAVKGDTFSYVQPLDTKILSQYGNVDPVYPSRESISALVCQVYRLADMKLQQT